ncbi:hypothetical protein DF185_20605 [Marinifilum breve]|jgi:hypothetical protein|uniref:Uncharacterized protein n=2 Tax=Marinifilum TaxID=866673 RepID=A0A419WWZ9_9BACT|nr:MULTISPECIES: hypothetical protein [Marinifilum]PXX96183.1 hypothetical protein DF185_20605 [Marinifilum breve]RKD99965.1 hypothetical protein BXY64_2951 [Marinifilum flexuosum]
MTIENRINLVVDDPKREAIETNLTGLKTELSTLLIALSPKQKKDLPKLGEHMMDFVERSYEGVGKNPTLAPSYIKMDEVKVDMEAWKLLHSIARDLEQLVSMLNDTATLCGSEAYSSMLSFYNYIKQASKDGVPGAKPLYDGLKHYFPGTGNSKDKTKDNEE